MKEQQRIKKKKRISAQSILWVSRKRSRWGIESHEFPPSYRPSPEHRRRRAMADPSERDARAVLALWTPGPFTGATARSVSAARPTTTVDNRGRGRGDTPRRAPLQHAASPSQEPPFLEDEDVGGSTSRRRGSTKAAATGERGVPPLLESMRGLAVDDHRRQVMRLYQSILGEALRGVVSSVVSSAPTA